MKKALKTIFSVILVLSMVVGMTAILTACNKDDKKDDAAYDGIITVGMECGYDPFNYTQLDDANGAVKIANADGYANGYDVMIAKKIAESLNRQLVIYKYDWDALVPAVQAGTLDFIIAGMSPTAERKESIDFSDAYYESQLVIVVRKDGKYANATSLSDFNGAKIVAQNGTFHDSALEKQGPLYGIQRQTPMGTFPEMINALNTKAFDGYVAESPGAIADCASNANLTYVHLINNDTGFTATPEDVQIAVGLKKGSEYRTAINRVLSELSQEDRDAIMATAIEYATADSTPEKQGVFKTMGNILSKYGLWILKGIGYTLLVSIIGTIVGLGIGLLIGVFRTMPTPKNKYLKVLKKIADWLLSAYIEIFRGTPMMVQALVIFWGFALINDGRLMNVIFAGLLIVSINTGAYMAEIVRGGIISVSKGQFEGAHAIGMTHSQTMFYVVIPQVLRNILPSVANEFVINIKDTSVLNVIGFTELFFMAKSIVAINVETFATYLLVAAIYFVLTFTITRILRLIEKKMDGKKDYTVQGSQNMDADSIVREQTAQGGNNND